MESFSLKMKKSLPRWWKKRFSATITETDPSCKVVYLGNVLTGWAKGEGCLDKPLATLWKNYCQSSRPDVSMRLSVCSSGLQATTSEHGLTEYWAHRVTWCAAPPCYPRIFAWVYRHEGRRLKQELRCHAVLCTTGRQARQLTARLQQRLREALHDFRREKMNRQSARLSLASCLLDDFSDAIPRRKLLLAPGVNNYKPPVERCKSAPKLGCIEEAPEEALEEADWLRVLALRTHPHSKLTSPTVTSPPAPPLPPRTLETVTEEERYPPLPPPPPPPLPALCQLLSSVECDSTPEDVSPDGLLDLAEVKVTLMPDGGISCVDGVTSSSSRGEGSLNRWDKFGSTGCVITEESSPPSPPALPRRVRRSLPCRAANIHDYAAEQQHNRILTRRQSQPEHVGLTRRTSSEYYQRRDEYLYDEMLFRLRLDSAVELLEGDSTSSFSGSSPCSSADQSPNLADKANRLSSSMTNPGIIDRTKSFEDTDNVSDESGYSDDKDVISSSSSASSASSTKRPVGGGGACLMAEEFTLNL